MVVRDLLLLTIFISLVVGHPSPTQQGEENGDSAIGKFIQYFKDFNVTNLLASFHAPPCIEECFGKLDALPSLSFNESWSAEKTKAVCTQHEKLENCLAKKPDCRSLVVEIGLYVLEFLCNDDHAITGFIPCIRRESVNIHTGCERSCKLGATLMDAASLNTKKSDVLNFVDEQGGKILSVPNIHTICNTSTCFLDCMKKGLDEKCPNGGTSFIDKVLRSVATRLAADQHLADTKLVDTYSTFFSSVLPSQCQHLVLKETNIVLTTPGSLFPLVAKPPEIATAVTLPGPASATGNGGLEVNSINDRNDKNNDDTSEVGMRQESERESSAYSISPSMLLIPLLSMALRY